MDRLEAMGMLIEAIDLGSLTAASRKLNVPLPTLSRKITDLEAHLGVKLLTRTTRRITLTDAGASYVTTSRRIIEQVEDAERAAAGEYSAPRGELILTAPILFGRRHVLPIVIDFLARYPEINIRLVLSDRNVHLIDDHVDMAVRIGRLPDSNLVSTRGGSMRHCICASPDFLASHGTPKAPGDIADQPCVTHDFTTTTTGWPFRVPGQAQDVTVPVSSRLSVTTAEAAIDACAAGVGFTRLLSYQVEDAVAAGMLIVVLAGFEPESYPVNLMHAGRGNLPLKMRSFLDFATPQLRQSLASQGKS